MGTNYLLPCPACKHETSIEVSQAGSQLKCTCGETLDVPDLREIRRLRPAPEDTATPRHEWNARKGVMLVGMTLLLVGIGTAIYFGVTMPREPVMDVQKITEYNHELIDDLSLLNTWYYYQRVLEFGLVQAESPAQMQYSADMRAFTIRMLASLASVCLGLVVLVVGWTLRFTKQ